MFDDATLQRVIDRFRHQCQENPGHPESCEHFKLDELRGELTKLCIRQDDPLEVVLMQLVGSLILAHDKISAINRSGH